MFFERGCGIFMASYIRRMGQMSPNNPNLKQNQPCHVGMQVHKVVMGARKFKGDLVCSNRLARVSSSGHAR